LIAQLERHDDKTEGHLIVGKTGSAQRVLDLFDADIPDHAVPQRKVAHAIYQRKDFNVANPVLAEGLRDGPLSISRADECDRAVDSKRRVSSGCAKHQIAA
jgi:hypothetical protein